MNDPRAIDDSNAPSRRAWYGLLPLIVLAMLLYVPGIKWGLPGTVSWSQDTIAGMRTIGPVTEWPADWKGRYPPLHYLILYTAYRPILNHWQADGGYRYDPTTGRHDFAPPHAERFESLYLLARSATVVMAAACMVFLCWATLHVTGDCLAALLSAIPLPLCAAFVYFAHLGNVDVPSVAWLAASLVFYVRAFRWRRISDCALLGLTAAFAVCTKDAVAGVLPGMAVMLAVAEFRRHMQAPWPKRIGATLLQWRWLGGLITFLLPFAYLNGLFHDPSVFARRMGYWLDLSGETRHAGQYQYDNQFKLLAATFWYAAGAVGWPMLAAAVAAAVYAMRRHAAVAFLMLAPVVSYYAIVIAPIGFVYSRFLFPVFVFVSVLIGIAAADLLRSRIIPAAIRLGVPIVVVLLTLGYSVALVLEMCTDSRYRAEAWFKKNVPQSADVGAFPAFEDVPFRPQYLPRLHDMGYRTYPVPMRFDSFEREQPEFLVLSSYDYEDFDEIQERCRQALVRGELGYRALATFSGRWLGTGSSWLSMAGWWAPTPGKISPTLIILKRDDTTPSGDN